MRDQDKFRGCLIGGAAGDALGFAVEFLREKQIFRKYGKHGITEYDLTNGVAQISDDTQMTLFTANGLLLGIQFNDSPIKFNFSGSSLESVGGKNRRSKGIKGFAGFTWETDGAWLTGFSTLSSGVYPSEEQESFLSQILQANVPETYFLSPKACLGILRRASKRGKELPAILKSALERQAGLRSA